MLSSAAAFTSLLESPVLGLMRFSVSDILFPDNNSYYYLQQGGYVLPIICLSV